MNLGNLSPERHNIECSYSQLVFSMGTEYILMQKQSAYKQWDLILKSKGPMSHTALQLCLKQVGIDTPGGVSNHLYCKKPNQP